MARAIKKASLPMTPAALDLDALEALQADRLRALQANIPGNMSIWLLNANAAFDEAIRKAAPALIAAARERDRLVTKPKVACPIALEHDHWICSAGICDVCQDDLRKQIGIRDTEITRLREAFSIENEAICQVLGKVLGYPWFKDDPANFPDATEADGVCVGEHVAISLADEAAARITRLREALEAAEERFDWLSGQGGTDEVIEFVEISLARTRAALGRGVSDETEVGCLRE